MIDQNSFEEINKDWLDELKMHIITNIKEAYDDTITELSTGESNFNNADPTSGMKVWEDWEIRDMTKEYLKKIIGDFL